MKLQEGSASHEGSADKQAQLRLLQVAKNAYKQVSDCLLLPDAIAPAVSKKE